MTDNKEKDSQEKKTPVGTNDDDSKTAGVVETEYHAFSHRVVDSTDDEQQYVPPGTENPEN